MIKNIIDDFHQHRLAGEHKKAMTSIEALKTRFLFSNEEVLTTLINLDFSESECIKYLKEHSLKRE